MSLTRKLLKELELTDAAIERIITAHTATVDALRQEREAALSRAKEGDNARQELDGLRPELDKARQEAASTLAELVGYRAQVEAARHRDARRNALSEALEKQGANPSAVPLMLDAITLPEEAWQGDTLADAGAALHPFQERYGALFARRTPMPVTKVHPPVSSSGALTPADVKHMSAEDINRHWSAVSTALQNNRT